MCRNLRLQSQSVHGDTELLTQQRDSEILGALFYSEKTRPLPPPMTYLNAAIWKDKQNYLLCGGGSKSGDNPGLPQGRGRPLGARA